jgi:hypothetical protein
MIIRFLNKCSFLQYIGLINRSGINRYNLIDKDPHIECVQLWNQIIDKTDLHIDNLSDGESHSSPDTLQAYNYTLD